MMRRRKKKRRKRAKSKWPVLEAADLAGLEDTGGEREVGDTL